MFRQGYLSNDEYEKVVQSITEIVSHSFYLRPMPSGNLSESECTRRVEICGEIWNTISGELLWEPERTIDHMTRFLVAILDGKKLSDYSDELDTMQTPGVVSAMWAPKSLLALEPEQRLSALAKNKALIIEGNGGSHGN